MPRILSNNPARGSNNWSGFKRVTTQTKRSVRRLIKRNPSDGLSLPFADKITTTRGTNSGVSPAGVVKKANASTTSQGSGGVSRIRDRGKNTTLKKR